MRKATGGTDAQQPRGTAGVARAGGASLWCAPSVTVAIRAVAQRVDVVVAVVGAGDCRLLVVECARAVLILARRVVRDLGLGRAADFRSVHAACACAAIPDALEGHDRGGCPV